jgi:hypothetical protein
MLDFMANRFDYLAMLQDVVQQVYRCSAIHSESAHVHETLNGQTLWNGEVEVFELVGHAKAKKCYAWLYRENGQNTRFITVLGRELVASPEMAVKSAIFFNTQPTPYPRPNEPFLKTVI